NHMHFKQLMSTDIKMNEEVIVTEDKKPLHTESELSPLAKAVVYCINKRISEKDLSKDAEARYHRTMELMNEMSFAYKIQTMSLIDSAREEFGKGWSRNYLNILNPLFEKFQVAS